MWLAVGLNKRSACRVNCAVVLCLTLGCLTEGVIKVVKARWEGRNEGLLRHSTVKNGSHCETTSLLRRHSFSPPLQNLAGQELAFAHLSRHLFIMATCTVHFDFFCSEAKTLTYRHSIPSSLITNTSAKGKDTRYNELLRKTVEPIMKEHEEACRNAFQAPVCNSCGSPANMVLQSPMSWLNGGEGEPLIGVWVTPFCGKGRCETRLRQEVQEEMDENFQDNSGPAGQCIEIMACQVCGRTEGIKRCGRCKAIGYCGTDHQKADWKVHKMMCIAAKDG